MLGRRVLLSAALWGGLAALSAGSAGAASWLEMNFYLSGPRYDGILPPCDHPKALRKIAIRFGQKEGKFWNSELQIVDFDNIRETAFRPWAANTIPRRFCSGIVELSDGIRRPIHYSIAEDAGIIGAYAGIIGAHFGVEWCVVGLDRNWSYNPRCRAAMP